MKTRMAMTMVALGLALGVLAGEMNGVTMKDSVTVGGKALVLNGMGLRKKLTVKVYVAGLYLEKKSSDAAAILKADGPRHIELEFVRDVGKDKIADAWTEGLEHNTPNASADVKAKMAKVSGWMEDIKEKDRIVFSYAPGKGTEISVKGKVKGTLEGKDLADALFACFIGPKPPTEDLKEGLLGK